MSVFSKSPHSIGWFSLPKVLLPTLWRRSLSSAVDIKQQSRNLLHSSTDPALVTKYRDEPLHVCFSELDTVC